MYGLKMYLRNHFEQKKTNTSGSQTGSFDQQSGPGNDSNQEVILHSPEIQKSNLTMQFSVITKTPFSGWWYSTAMGCSRLIVSSADWANSPWRSG